MLLCHTCHGEMEGQVKCTALCDTVYFTMCCEVYFFKSIRQSANKNTPKLLLWMFSSSSSLFPECTVIPPLKHCRKQGGSFPCWTCIWIWVTAAVSERKRSRKQSTSISSYLCSSLFVQLNSHECRCSFLTDRGVSALPEKIAALLPARTCTAHLIRLLPAAHCTRTHTHIRWHLEQKNTDIFIPVHGV